MIGVIVGFFCLLTVVAAVICFFVTIGPLMEEVMQSIKGRPFLKLALGAGSGLFCLAVAGVTFWLFRGYF